MMRRLLLIASLLLFAPAVMADAPLGQYAPFVRETTSVHDTKTQLEWDRPPTQLNVTPYTRVFKTFAAAPSVCPSMFRLPTVKELLTLVDEAPHKEYDDGHVVEKAIDQLAFGSSTGADAPYWTSTPSDEGGKVWGVSFKDGTLAKLNTASDSAYVRCVK